MAKQHNASKAVTNPDEPRKLPEEIERVTIYEDWNEREDSIYYRWKLPEEIEWHEKLTGYKQKPLVVSRHMSRFEYENEFYKRWEMEKRRDGNTTL